MRRTLACMTALLLATPGLAQEGDVEMGAELAAEHCAGCHDITPGGVAKTMPPSFASIAGFRSPDQITARIWFPASLHSSMPNMAYMLNAGSAADLTAYIMSLEGE